MENKEIKNEKNLIMENTEKWIVDAHWENNSVINNY